jgi:hypothetical protein
MGVDADRTTIVAGTTTVGTLVFVSEAPRENAKFGVLMSCVVPVALGDHTHW